MAPNHADDQSHHHGHSQHSLPQTKLAIVVQLVQCRGVYQLRQPVGYLRTTDEFANYVLRLQWRFDPVTKKAGNSGVLLRMVGEDTVWPRSVEAQLHSGNAGDFWVIGGIEIQEHAKGGKRVSGRRTVKLKTSSEKEPGQWNKYDIICKDDWILVLVNGVLQNVGTRCSDKLGKICLQSEGAQIEYRNIYIEPLE